MRYIHLLLSVFIAMAYTNQGCRCMYQSYKHIMISQVHGVEPEVIQFIFRLPFNKLLIYQARVEVFILIPQECISNLQSLDFISWGRMFISWERILYIYIPTVFSVINLLEVSWMYFPCKLRHLNF
jgi:hypothetical protein